MRPENPRALRFPAKGPMSREAAPPMTILEVFFHAKSIHGDSPALRAERPCPRLTAEGTAPPSEPVEKWQTWTWNAYWDECRALGKALVAAGVKRYDGVLVYGFNCPEWVITQIAATMAGGITAGVYPSDAPSTILFKCQHSKSRVAVVEDFDKLKRLEEIIEQATSLTHVVGYSPNFITASLITRKDGSIVHVMPWADFLKLGSGVADATMDEIQKSIKPEDCAGLIYTSGTTGNPKAVMMTHDNLVAEARAIPYAFPQIGEAGQERVLSFLPLSHVAALMVDIVMPMVITAVRPGYVTTHFARPYDLRAGALGDRLRAVKPTIFFAVPRVWEKMAEKIDDKLRLAHGIKGYVVTKSRAIGLEHQRNLMLGGSGEVPAFYEKAKNALHDKIQQALGLEEAKISLTGAAPIAQATLEFFASFGLNINETYGMSECTGSATVGTDRAHVWGSCGHALVGSEVAVMTKKDDGTWAMCPNAKDLFAPTEAEQGELCYRGRHIMLGYMSNPELGDHDEVLKKNQEAIDSNGWLHSGDKGCLDERGMVRITGRFKELIIGAGGENIAPVPVEDAVKRFGKGVVSNVIMVGDKRKFNVMLITLLTKGATGEKPGSDELVGLAAELVPGVTKVSEAVVNPQFFKAIEQFVKHTNADGNAVVSAAARVTKFSILPTDFSIETGDFTPTLKLKRNVVEAKYAKLIDALCAMTGEEMYLSSTGLV